MDAGDEQDLCGVHLRSGDDGRLSGSDCFLSAWTLYYWQAWALLAVIFGSYVAAMMGSLAHRDPTPIRRRKPGGPQLETPTSQRIIAFVVTLGFVALFVVAGFDYRFGWSSVPPSISLAACLLVAAGLLITCRVYQEMLREEIIRRSCTTSATTEEAPDLRMVSTGPFAVVRHPMQAGTLLYEAAIPVALGSWWGLVVFAVMAPLALVQLLYAEKILRQKTSDYFEYAQKVEYRLLPHVW